MRRYVGKTCPYCKGSFAAGDDVVICSECEMPHHKACWVENQGCTTFGCNGTIMCPKADALDDDLHFDMDFLPADGAMRCAYCAACGNALEAQALFCPHCGQPVRQNPQTGAGQAQSKAETSCVSQSAFAEEERYIVQNADYYRKRFQKLRDGHKKADWNWAAFLFAPYWCMYRKLYGVGGIALCGTLLLSLCGTIGWILSAAAAIVFGIFASALYLQSIEKWDAAGRALEEPMRTQYIAKKGGTNAGAAALAAIGHLVLLTIILLKK